MSVMIQIADAQCRAQPVDLHGADADGGEAEDRTHREIDMAHDDDQHHAGGHHRDGGSLDQQDPQVARREEGAAKQPVAAAHDGAGQIEADPDHQQRTQHAEHARVDFGGPEKARQRAFAFHCWVLRVVGRSHWRFSLQPVGSLVQALLAAPLQNKAAPPW
jgi:hypothetical protein